MSKSRLRTIFSGVRRVLGHKAWKPTTVDERTWRRWLSGQTQPDGHSAKSVAFEVWHEFAGPKGEEYKTAVFAIIRNEVPYAPCNTWTEITFGAWFFELAEAERGRTTKVPEDPLTATLDLEVWRPELHDCVSVREAGVRPLRAGDGVRVRVEASQPLYFYLVWVTFEAQRRLHSFFYPMTDGFEKLDPAKEVLDCPPARTGT